MPTSFQPRTLFSYDTRLFWRPGHQHKALRSLERGIGNIDLVVEVRDARIPISSSSRSIHAALGRRDCLTVFNKADLANSNMRKNILDSWKKHGHDAIFTSIHNDKSIKQILHYAIEKSTNDPSCYPAVSVVIVGLPNVGKSSLLNSLRRIGLGGKKVAPVAPFAGVTRAIQNRVKIWADPPVYLVDTPGIFDPHIIHPVQGLKVALTGGTKDRLVEQVHVADYLLYKLNKSIKCREKYVAFFKLTEPSNSINEILIKIAQIHNCFVGGRAEKPVGKHGLKDQFDGLDLERAAEMFIRAFRKGDLGVLTLDSCLPEVLDQWFKDQKENGEAGDG